MYQVCLLPTVTYNKYHPLYRYITITTYIVQFLYYRVIFNLSQRFDDLVALTHYKVCDQNKNKTKKKVKSTTTKAPASS